MRVREEAEEREEGTGGGGEGGGGEARGGVGGGSLRGRGGPSFGEWTEQQRLAQCNGLTSPRRREKHGRARVTANGEERVPMNTNKNTGADCRGRSAESVTELLFLVPVLSYLVPLLMQKPPRLCSPACTSSSFPAAACFPETLHASIRVERKKEEVKRRGPSFGSEIAQFEVEFSGI